MWFKHRAWIPIAWLLSLGNLIAVWFAARPAEPWHATIHALLAVLFGLGAQRLAARQKARGGGRISADEHVAARLESIEQEISSLRQQLSEAHDRLDFAERLLARPRDELKHAPQAPSQP